MESFTTEMVTTVSIVRSLLSSRKDAASITEILREYLELEGQPMPRFGYKSIEDFLMASDEFIMRKTNNQYFISAKVNKNSLHINKLVSEQKSDSKRRRGSNYLRTPRRLHNKPNSTFKNSPNSSTGAPAPSAYSKLFSQKPTRSPRKFISSNRAMSNNTQNDNRHRNMNSEESRDDKMSYSIVYVDGKPVYRPFNNSNNNYNNNNNNNNNNESNNKSNKNKEQELLKSNETNPKSKTLLSSSSFDGQTLQSSYDKEHQKEKSSSKPHITAPYNLNNKTNNTTAQLHYNINNGTNNNNNNVNNNNNNNINNNNNNTNNNNNNNNNNKNNINNSNNNNQECRSASLLMRQHSMPNESLHKQQQQQQQQKSNVKQSVSFNKASNIQQRLSSQMMQPQQITSPPLSPIMTTPTTAAPSVPASPTTINYEPVNRLKSTVNNRLKNHLPSPPVNNDYANGDESILSPTSDHDYDISSNTRNVLYDKKNVMQEQRNKNLSNLNNNDNNFLAIQDPFSSINVQDLEKLNPVKSLEMYCELKKYSPPQYKFYKLKKTGRIQCRIQIFNSNYSTYPSDFPSEHHAQIETAKVALNELRLSACREKFPICMDSDFDLSVKLYNLLKNYKHGVFKTKIPELFQSTYKETLSGEWFKLITVSPQMFSIEDSVQDDFIIYANIRKQSSSIASSSSGSAISENNFNNNINNNSNNNSNNNNNTDNTDNTRNKTNKFGMDKLILPWSEKHWNIFVTNPVTTTEVWARLIGPEYSDEMDSITTDIELLLLTEKLSPKELKKNHIYLVAVSECWYRVRIESIDASQQRCFCFFIDVGDSDWFANNEIFACDKRFLKFPAQAICFSLFGLEDFTENPYAKRHLDEHLGAKILIGEILTKSDEYQAQDDSPDYEPKIQTVLFDTTSEEDVYVNPLILNCICKDTPTPQLQRSVLTYCTISHVNDFGNIFLQIQDNGLHYIQKIIYNLITSNFNREQYRLKPTDYQDEMGQRQSNDQIYLIMDKNDMKWYRATIISDNVFTNICEMFYIDFGMIKPVSKSSIYRLDSLSAALHRYPCQAICAKLFGVSTLSDSNIATLRGQLTIDTKVFVKQMGTCTGNIPAVNIYKRLEKDNLLVSINESIRIEQEAFELSTKLDHSNANTKFSLSSKMTNLQLQPKDNGQSDNNNKSTLQKILNPTLPKINDLFNVSVTMASNPTYFKVRSHKEGPTLQEMMLNLQQFCKNNINSNCNTVPELNIIKGEAYAGLHTDKNWYRVTVENIYNESMIHICYCDYGDIEIVGKDKLILLPEQFRTLPKQAISAKLHGIQPKNKDWNLEDCLYFQKLTVNKQFVSIVKNVTTDTLPSEGPLLELVLVDVSTSDDININNIFINENRASLID